MNWLQEFINKVNLNTLGPYTFIYYLLPSWWLNAVAQVLADTGLQMGLHVFTLPGVRISGAESPVLAGCFLMIHA